MASATAAPVVTAPAAAKESSLPPATPPLEHKTSSVRDSVKPKLPPVVKDVSKSPVNGHGNGSTKKHQSRPTTPLSRHHSLDHGHPHGCGCHKCLHTDVIHVHPHGCACHKCTYTEVTHVGEAYCPNPNTLNVVKDYETKVRIIQRIPEMRKVEKTFFVKQLVHEKRTQTVRKSRIIMEDVETMVTVPVIREVPRLKKIAIHKVHEEFNTITDMVPVIEYQKRTRITKIPRCVMEDVDERITVPVIKEVAVVKTVQEPTGEFCEQPIEEYCTPGDFNLLCKDGRHHGDHHKRKAHSHSSSSDSESDSDESDDEKPHHSHSRDLLEFPKRGKPLSPIKTKPVPHHSKEPLSPIKPKAVSNQPKEPLSPIKPKAVSNHPKEPLSPTKLKVAETKPVPHHSKEPLSPIKTKAVSNHPKEPLSPTVAETKPVPHHSKEPLSPIKTKAVSNHSKEPLSPTKLKVAETKPNPHEEPHPELKPKVPETKPKAPEVKAPAPETKPKVPETKPKAPETKAPAPETKPKAPETKTKVPDSKPKIPEMGRDNTTKSKAHEGEKGGSRSNQI